MDLQDEIGNERKKIGQIDFQIFQLVSERLTIAQRIGNIKKKHDLPIRDYQVENEVITRSKGYSKELDISEEMALKLVNLLIDESILVQEKQQKIEPRATSNKKALIIGGLGKMGGWLSNFFNSTGFEIEIIDKLTIGNNVSIKSMTERINNFEFIAICTPLNTIGPILSELFDLNPQGVIFEIGSLKSHLLNELACGIKKGLKISSLHPMFGPNIRTLSGRNVILASCGSKEADSQIKMLFANTACNLIEIPVTEHDSYMAISLGLSHAVNLLFGQVLSKSGFSFQTLNKFSSTTFLKQVRTAEEVFSENPDLYYSIQKYNSSKDALYNSLEQGLHQLKQMIDNDDARTFIQFIQEHKKYFMAK